MKKNWAYLHSNGKVIVKPWFGDVKDYTDDCKNNPFVLRVLEPYDAPTLVEAGDYAAKNLLPAPAMMFRIYSLEHNAWWKPAEHGYCKDIREAGEYTYAQAMDIVSSANQFTGSKPNEAMVPITRR